MKVILALAMAMVVAAGMGPAAAAPDLSGAASLSESDRARLDRMYRDAIEQYRDGKIDAARGIWNEMLSIYPGDKRAQTFLAETQPAHDRAVETRKKFESNAAHQTTAQELLNSPVTVSTDHPTPLGEFMRVLSYSTPKELQYSVVEGADTQVTANFVDKPLHEVLDAICKPAGIHWRMDARNLITISPSAANESFSLTASQAEKIQAMLDSGELQRAVWGQSEPPGKDISMTLEARRRVLLVSGSPDHLRKVRGFISALNVASQPDLETRIYKIREEDGPRVRALINAILASDSGRPLSQQRKVFVDGGDLIIRDTPENIRKTEELLLDQNFFTNLKNEKLEIANFSLVPREVENMNSDQVGVFTNRVVEAIQTFLYAKQGIKASEAQGRRLWFDPATYQLTIVDTPENIETAGRYIESLPELRQKKLQRVVHLSHQVAEDMAGELQEILGLGPSDGIGPKGDQVIKVLRRGDQFTFHDLRVRLIRIEEGDPTDRNDDEAELQLNTGTQVSNITIRELDTTYFENYEITAEDVQPAGGSGPSSSNSQTRGEGRARIRVRYVEPIQGP